MFTFMNFLCERGHYVIRKMLAIKKGIESPATKSQNLKSYNFDLKYVIDLTSLESNQ